MQLRAIAMAVLALGATAGRAESVDDYLIRPALIRQVSPHVRIIPDEGRNVVPNVGFVLGRRALLVVDTGLGPRNGAIVAAEAARLAKGKPVYLVTTHVHPEHDLGAQAFPAATRLIRSTEQIGQAAVGAATAAGFSARSPAMAELLRGAAFRPADIRFDGAYRLDLGGVTVRLLAMGTNHTPGDTAIWIEGDRTLFAGDIAMRRTPSAASPRTSLAHWIASLDRLAALRPVLIVPSHWATGDATLIADYRALFESLRAAVAPLKAAGRSEGDTVAELVPRFLARWPDRDRLAGLIRAAYANG